MPFSRLYSLSLLLLFVVFLGCSEESSISSQNTSTSAEGDTRDVGDAHALEDTSVEGDVTGEDTDLGQDSFSGDTSSEQDTTTGEDTLSGLFRDVALESEITRVQPMTGIVLWEDSWNDHLLKTTPGHTQLEYAYVAPSSIVLGDGTYDWTTFEGFLDRIAAREHQAIVRFYYTYPGEETAVPSVLKARSDYSETSGIVEGEQTWFPDWSSAALEDFHLAFFSKFAEKYDGDPRVAFLQVGFGLWGEYHIYKGPNEIGLQFPTKAFQDLFIRHLAGEFSTLHWSISIDAFEEYYSPFSTSLSLLEINFGNFDDSFMNKEHGDYNESAWDFFGHATRYETSPHGGEFSYYSNFDQEHVLDTAGIYGHTYAEMSAKFHISYMIGNDQPNYQADTVIREASMESGYKFRITRFQASAESSLIEVQNEGIAPIYYDAFIAVNGVRAATSLKGLLPGETQSYSVELGGESPKLSIECDRLVDGQFIEFNASLH